MDVQEMLSPYRPSVSVPELVRALNRSFHEIAAERYDLNHSEIWKQELPVFVRQVEIIRDNSPVPSMAVLDYGCGTGFGCYQALKILGTKRIASVNCVDPSPAMLAKCKQRLDGIFPGARHSSDPDAFLGDPQWLEHYDIVITNSVLHHVYAWDKLVRRLIEFLKPGGFYLMGNEPSSRFHANPECRKSHEAFWRERRWAKYLDGRSWASFARRKLGLEADLGRSTAQAAFRAGLTQGLLPGRLVAELVDYHAPHWVQGVARAEGLDFRLIEKRMAGLLTLQAVETYIYIDSSFTERLTPKWRKIAEQLGKKYPLDGASFCALWKKVA